MSRSFRKNGCSSTNPGIGKEWRRRGHKKFRKSGKNYDRDILPDKLREVQNPWLAPYDKCVFEQMSPEFVDIDKLKRK